MVKYLSLTGLLATVAWFFWNPKDWEFDWEPVVVFLGSLALYIQQEIKNNHKSEFSKKFTTTHPADIELYKNLIDLLPSAGIIQFLSDHDFIGSFNRETIDPLNTFRCSWDNAEHRFFDTELEKLRNELYVKTKLFYAAIAEYTSPNEYGFQAVKNENPHITAEKDWKYWQDRYRNEGNIINDRADDLVKAHQLLVEKAREKLI